ncbi:hypothetical protein OHA72_36630 [Dactylosporangium sp. NBC_01737]|uniref:hypothetical protein n=1 Tax=Dactylosporangium sp. NBC_01737 TaxID=2975959 RepID=UPI002E0F0960|nr:hypothetical protein OHA72_36630 [Dactylosporangium sp. NBC_01737]
MLFGDADDPRSWLRSGEALSALWLAATVRGVSVVPLSDVIEVTRTRQAIRRFLGSVGHPHLVLRLGIPDPEGSSYPWTPRFTIDEIIA